MQIHTSHSVSPFLMSRPPVARPTANGTPQTGSPGLATVARQPVNPVALQHTRAAGLDRLERLADRPITTDPAARLSAAREKSAAQPQPTSQPHEMTLEGLLAAWGQAESRYDLNGDGTVDVLDLLQFLNSMPPAEE